jgi:ACR3 family arsenite transporter
MGDDRAHAAARNFAAMGEVARHWRGIAATLGVNWLIKPFSMALLGWLFVGWLFRPLLPEGRSRATSPA